MLKDVEHAGVIDRRGLECDGEGLVFVVGLQVKQSSAAFLMTHAISYAIEFGDGFNMFYRETVKCCAACEIQDSPPFIVVCRNIVVCCDTAYQSSGDCGFKALSSQNNCC